jgi:hypothetical protein
MSTSKQSADPSSPLDEKHEDPHHIITLAEAERERAKVIEVEDPNLAAALTSGPQLNPRSLASIQLYFILIVAFMGSMSNGFDGQVTAIVLIVFRN